MFKRPIISIDDLKEALHINGVNTLEDLNNAVEEIATALFNNFIIVNGDRKYRFVEIEFYHKLIDEGSGKGITIPRENAHAGDWFLHDFGVDIAFETSGESYGGILIRSVVEGDSYETGNNFKCGPRKAFWEIFDGLNALRRVDNHPHLEENVSNIKITPERYARWPFGQDNYKYRFTIPIDYWKKPKGYTAYPKK